MEDEFDLRPYLRTLGKYWFWIVGVTLLAAVAAYGLSSLIPPTYQATALVAITDDGLRVQFDPRFQTVEETKPLRAYPELATSDQLLLTLLDDLPADLQSVESPGGLRQRLEAQPGSDPSIMRLNAYAADPETAAQLANLWAEQFVQFANRIYGNQGGEQLAFFEERLAESGQALERSEAALVEFQARNRANILGAELEALQARQVEYLAQTNKLQRLIQDVANLRTLLETQPAGSNVNFADQLTALTLQIQAFGFEAPLLQEAAAPGQFPVQLLLNSPDNLTISDRREQIDLLEGLQETLVNAAQQIDEAIGNLEPQILTLQQEKQAVDTESARLTRDRDLAQETYLALARKVDAERITSQDVASGVQLASRAAVPGAPAGPNKLLNSVAAAVVAFFGSILVIFLVKWWAQ